MHSSDDWSDNAMPWNASDNHWQDNHAAPWNASDSHAPDNHMNAMLDFMGTMNGGSESTVWHKQPTKDTYAHKQAVFPLTFGQWQPGSDANHAFRNSQGGYADHVQASHHIRDFKPARPPPSFAALRKLQGDDGSDDSETDTGPSSVMVASSDDDVGRETKKGEPVMLSREAMIGMEATEAEVEEAERVVRTAFHDTKVRDRMRSKVSTASPNDLQAMLNARLNKAMQDGKRHPGKR